MNNERHELVSIIGKDLLRRAKAPLLLLILLLASAILVITFTHYTRLLIAEREQLFLEQEALNIEWRNLILEEKVLGQQHRIERIAIQKLNMQHVDLKREKIIIY